MLKNYFKIAWRNLLKNKGYSFINIGGLAIGLGCFLLIAIFIKNEVSYDTYHENYNRIYRIAHHNNQDDYEQRQIWGNAPVGPALQKDFSEIVEKVQFSGRSAILLEYNNQKFQEDDTFYVDPTVFGIFSWPLLSGNPETALEAPYSIVLTETTAKKYFGNEDPMGKTVIGAGGRANDGNYTVTGVMQDVPSNSHFSFDALMSMSSFYQTRPGIFDSWGYVDFYTYFLVIENFDQQAFQAKIPAFLKRNRPEEMDKYYYDLSFEPLKDAYLNSPAARQPGITGNRSNLNIFGLIGLFILIIAGINFVNLATARSLERAKEVGIRKVIGAERKGLVFQFLGESIVMVFIGTLIGFTLVILNLPWLRNITGKPFGMEELLNAPILSVFIAAALFTAVVAGLYPAFTLSNFKPAKVLKGIFKTSAHGVSLRKGLVVFQFTLSIALIASTIIVYNQLGFMLDKNLGFDQQQQLVIDYNWDNQVISEIETIKAEFASLPDVISAANSRTVPGSHFPAAGTRIESPQGSMVDFVPFLYEVDTDFVAHYDIEVVAGRAFSREFPADTISSLIVNETAAKSFGYANPPDIVGKRFEQWGREGAIIGVVKDFNYLSLHQTVAPLTIRNVSYGALLSLKIQSANVQQAIAAVQEKWRELAPHRPFIYSFLDESFNEQYEADIRFRKLFTIFSFLAICIACLGLLGLATYSALQRTKEIGVRKVLGAHMGNIVTILTKDFIKLVFVALLIASPISWYVMTQWLDSYPYHIDIKFWVFALAGIIAITIAILTVSFQAIKSASRNPVKSLRTE